jgi:hypothetical protein
VKVGAENRTKLIAAVLLGAVALVLAGTRFIGSSGDSSPSASTPVAANIDPTTSVQLPAPRNQGKKRNASKKQQGALSLDPTLRYDMLRASEDTKYEGSGRNIFRAYVEIPKPITPITSDKQEAPKGPPPPPPPPPIELKYYGFANVVSKPGEPRSIFLAHGEDVFIAKEGDIVNRRYKIVHATPNAVEILDVLSNNRQSIPLTQG